MILDILFGVDDVNHNNNPVQHHHNGKHLYIIMFYAHCDLFLTYIKDRIIMPQATCIDCFLAFQIKTLPQ